MVLRAEFDSDLGRSFEMIFLYVWFLTISSRWIRKKKYGVSRLMEFIHSVSFHTSKKPSSYFKSNTNMWLLERKDSCTCKLVIFISSWCLNLFQVWLKDWLILQLLCPIFPSLTLTPRMTDKQTSISETDKPYWFMFSFYQFYIWIDKYFSSGLSTDSSLRNHVKSLWIHPRRYGAGWS